MVLTSKKLFHGLPRLDDILVTTYKYWSDAFISHNKPHEQVLLSYVFPETPHALSGFEPESSAMSTAPRRQGSDISLIICLNFMVQHTNIQYVNK
jgi:hypothetical protein